MIPDSTTISIMVPVAPAQPVFSCDTYPSIPAFTALSISFASPPPYLDAIPKAKKLPKTLSPVTEVIPCSQQSSASRGFCEETCCSNSHSTAFMRFITWTYISFILIYYSRRGNKFVCSLKYRKFFHVFLFEFHLFECKARPHQNMRNVVRFWGVFANVSPYI